MWRNWQLHWPPIADGPGSCPFCFVFCCLSDTKRPLCHCFQVYLGDYLLFCRNSTEVKKKWVRRISWPCCTWLSSGKAIPVSHGNIWLLSIPSTTNTEPPRTNISCCAVVRSTKDCYRISKPVTIFSTLHVIRTSSQLSKSVSKRSFRFSKFIQWDFLNSRSSSDKVFSTLEVNKTKPLLSLKSVSQGLLNYSSIKLSFLGFFKSPSQSKTKSLHLWNRQSKPSQFLEGNPWNKVSPSLKVNQNQNRLHLRSRSIKRVFSVLGRKSIKHICPYSPKSQSKKTVPSNLKVNSGCSAALAAAA